MDKKAAIAGLVVLPILTAEVVEADHHPPIGLPAFDSRASHSLATIPHTHFEVQDGTLPVVTNPFSVSGGQRMDDVFTLSIYPASTGGANLFGRPAGSLDSSSQPMFGHSQDIDALATLLSEQLPTPQVEAVRRGLLDEQEAHIGGSGGAVVRVFSRRELEQLNMSFRPLDI
jgi:hypothetical protein